MKYRKITCLLMCLLFGVVFTTPSVHFVSAQQNTTITVIPAEQTVAPGTTFEIEIVVNPGTAIAGMQFSLSFDPELVSANDIVEGNLLNQNMADTYFSPGVINNESGTITGVAGAITTPGETVSLEGTFAIITFTAGTGYGASQLELANVIIGDINGNSVPVDIYCGNVAVGVNTDVYISPVTRAVTSETDFTIDISVNPGIPVAGMQFDLSFDPALISANTVTEGNLLNQDMANTYFSSGVIDNQAGTIIGVAGAITTPGETVSSPEIFATINFTSRTTEGVSSLDLSSVIVGDIGGNPVPTVISNGSVNVTVLVALPGDANGDGVVNVLDMTKVARIILLLDAPTPGADANQDGTTNVLDITRIALIILGMV